MEVSDTGPDGQLSPREIGGQFAEVLDAELGREPGVIEGQADLFEGLAAGGLEGRFLGGVCFAFWTMRKCTEDG